MTSQQHPLFADFAAAVASAPRRAGRMTILRQPFKSTNYCVDGSLLDPFRRQGLHRDRVNYFPVAVRRWSLTEIHDPAVCIAAECNYAIRPSGKSFRRGPETELQRWSYPHRRCHRPQIWSCDFGRNVLLPKAFGNFLEGRERNDLKRVLAFLRDLVFSLSLLVLRLPRLLPPFLKIGHSGVQLLFEILFHNPEAPCFWGLALRSSIVNDAEQAVT
jgi:hypothetical protein